MFKPNCNDLLFIVIKVEIIRTIKRLSSTKTKEIEFFYYNYFYLWINIYPVAIRFF